VGSAGGGEDLAKHQPQPLVIDVRVGVVGPDQLRRPFHGGPTPAGAGRDRGARIGAQMTQLAGTADGHQPDDRLARQGVRQHPGVDHRRLGTAVATQRGEDDKPLVGGGDCGEGWEVGLGGASFPVLAVFQPPNSTFHSRCTKYGAGQYYSYSTSTEAVSGTAWQVRT
jgi:hypothetical protein